MIIPDPPLTELVKILGDHGLPTADLHRLENANFFSWVEGNVVLGVVGVEMHGRYGLLRSLAVRAEAQGKGIGAALLVALEDHADRSNLTDLYLLTDSAADFFKFYGYKEIDRSIAPSLIRATKQFSNLCPGSANLMRKSLKA